VGGAQPVKQTGCRGSMAGSVLTDALLHSELWPMSAHRSTSSQPCECRLGSMARSFPFAARADRFRRAQRALNESSKRPFFEGRDAALDEYWAAAEQALPPGFDQASASLRNGDPAGVTVAIEFLEADPIVFRSGYLKGDLVTYLKRVPLSEPQRERLRGVVLQLVASRDGREFRRYCQLARRLDGPEFRAKLEELAASSDADVGRRAGWVLKALI
jgi:hypothetical protein